jgi:hypothetical protein
MQITVKSNRRNKPDTIIRDRDRKILELVYKHRFLNSELIWHLLQIELETSPTEYKIGRDGKKRPVKYGFGEKALAKRLKQLSDSKYLKRDRPYDKLVGRGYGTQPFVYGLGLKSATLLANLFGITPDTIRDIVEANRVKTPFLRHSLEIAKFRVILELACHQSKGRIRLIFWEQGQHLWDQVIGRNERGGSERFPICPDAFFGLEVEGKGKAHYFLEVDRGTMPIVSTRKRTDIRKKIIGYRCYRQSRKYINKYYYRSLPNGDVIGLYVISENDKTIAPKLQNAESIEGFNVLFLVPGSIIGYKKIKGRLANILSAFPGFGKDYATTSLFWFATLDLFELNNPPFVFSRVWITPNPNNDLQSLIE